MVSLFDKIMGIEAATAAGVAMGDITEGMSHEESDAKYGTLCELLPHEYPEKFRKQEWGHDFHVEAHQRPAGMTEYGQERHRLLVTTVIEKGGRVTVEDLARIWLRDIDPAKFGYQLGPQEQLTYYALQAGIRPTEVGRHASWPGFFGTLKMIAPIGIINACNPPQAALDAMDVGRIRDVAGRPKNYALEVGAAIAAGVAEGLKPGATVERIIGVALDQLSSEPRQEIEMGLAWAREAGDWRALRPKYADHYRGRPISNAVEVLSSAVALFYLTGPDPREVIIRCVNFGRDTDCRVYPASAWAACITGIDGVPEDWVKTVDDQLKTDPYTVSRRSLRESADGLYRALLNNVASLRRQIESIESQCQRKSAERRSIDRRGGSFCFTGDRRIPGLGWIRMGVYRWREWID